MKIIKKQIRIILAYTVALLHTYLHKPKKVRLDICNLCQLDCAACWMRKNEELIKDKNGGFGYVKFETFKKFVDDNKFIEEIEISNNGEPLLNPDFNKILEYAYSKNIKLTAYNGVNLNHLTEEMAENIVKYKVQGITVSIDGATPETYAIYRRKGDFNKVIENIKLINKYKEIYGSIFPKLVYKFIVFGHNEHEINDAKKLAKKLKMDIKFYSNCSIEYSPYKNVEFVKKLTNMVNIQKYFLSLYYKSLKHRNEIFVCQTLFEEPQINFDGNLFGCCYLFLDSFKINVFKTGLLKALRSKKILHAKAMLLNFNVKPNKEVPCSQCEVYNELKQHKCDIKKIINYSNIK